MHELALAEGILQLIEVAARDQGFTKVRTVRLEIGKLSIVERAAIRFCFDAGDTRQHRRRGDLGDCGDSWTGLVWAVRAHGADASAV
jgi:hypothetical protein